MLATDNASHSISGLIFNGLVKYDRDLNVVGDLAESWDISKDGLVITFHLRKGVRWHDGQPFTAEDVLFTYRLTIDPKTPTAYAGDFLKVKKAEVLDAHTFRVTYDKPFAPALMSWGSSVMPKHLMEGKGRDKKPARAPPRRDGPLSLQGVEDGPEDRPRLQPRLFRGQALSRRTRHAHHPRHGHHVPRASRTRHRPDGAHAAAVHPADGKPVLPDPLPQVPLSFLFLHLPRLQSAEPHVRRQEGQAGPRLCRQQGRAHRRGAARPG